MMTYYNCSSFLFTHGPHTHKRIYGHKKMAILDRIHKLLGNGLV